MALADFKRCDICGHIAANRSFCPACKEKGQVVFMQNLEICPICREQIFGHNADFHREGRCTPKMIAKSNGRAFHLKDLLVRIGFGNKAAKGRKE